jgi:hypothetical protein
MQESDGFEIGVLGSEGDGGGKFVTGAFIHG